MNVNEHENADTEDLEDEVKYLDPGQHPLLRQGAMHRMAVADQEDEEDELDD